MVGEGPAAWTQTSGPHAVYYGSTTYFGYVHGPEGDIRVQSRPDGGVATAPITLHAAIEAADGHDQPSFWVRDSDHKLLAFYSAHLGPTIFMRVSTNSLDTDPTLSGGFATEVSLDASLGGRKYTYPHVGQIGTASMYLAYRDHNVSDADSYLALAASSDGGATWGAETLFMYNAGHDCYQMVHFGSGRIDFAISTGNGVTDTHISVYHLYWQGGNWFKSDGTQIVASLPLSPSDATLVHDGSAYPNGWPSGMAIDDTGAPVILYETLDTANGHSYVIKYARFASGSWTSTTVASFSDSGLALVAHSCLDETDPSRVWVSQPVNGIWELHTYVTANHGSSFSGIQMTSRSQGTGNVYPVNVHDRGSSTPVLFLSGQYATFLDFHTSIGTVGL